MIVEDIDKIAAGYGDLLRKYRRHLHTNPELSFKENATAAWVREHLAERGIPVADGVSGNSTVGIIKGSKEGPTLLFRADIDALPITEETGLSYTSANEGVMHACGHDAHTATLMCFADYLSKHRDIIKGTVKLVFQQGEEQFPGGGSIIVGDGVLDDVDSVYAWHCEPGQPVGTVVAAEGARTASCAEFDILVRGKGGHGGFPNRSIDPISTGAMIVSAINDMHGWYVDPMETATIVVTGFEAGKSGTYNVIPADAAIRGNIRTHNNELAERIYEKLEHLAGKICEAKDCECEFSLRRGYPALFNDADITEKVRDGLIENGIHAIKAKPIMGGEDFAYYTQEKPGLYFNVGTRNPDDDGTAFPPHSSHFCIDERAMEYALKTLIVAYNTMIS